MLTIKAGAQENKKENQEKIKTSHQEESFFETVSKDFLSPFFPQARYVTYTGIGVGTLFTVFEDTLNDGMEREAIEHRPIGSLSTVGELSGRLIPNALYAGGMFINYWLSKE